jgi:glycosyltransferase involved in cell wall biosynthesis
MMCFGPASGRSALSERGRNLAAVEHDDLQSDMSRRPAVAKRRVALVDNICPHYRRPLFEELARRFDLECFFFATSEPYWNPLLPSFEGGDFVQVDLPRSQLLGEPVMPTLAKRLSRARYDVVVMGLTGRLMLPYVFAATRARRLPFVLWTGTWHHPNTRFHRATRGLTEALYRRSEAIVVYGDHVRRALLAVQGVDDVKIFTAGQAVDEARFAGGADPTGSRRLLFVGQFEEHKGIADVLNGFGLVDDPTARLCLVGNGSLEGEIRRRASVDRRIEIVGHVPQDALPALYRSARALVLPSVTTDKHREAWGLVVNEAMHTGLPVVVTDAVGAAAGGLVENDVTGLVVPERNSRALGAAMSRLVSDDDLVRALAMRASERVSHYSFETMADAFESAVEFGIRGREPTERSVAVV